MKTIQAGTIGLIFSVALSFTLASSAYAHDGWVQTNVSEVSHGDMVYIDLQFGNHGNMHRDYKIHASKWDKSKSTFLLHTPKGQQVDFEDGVVDIGADTVSTFCNGATTYTDKNGYLVASFQAAQKGMYIVDARQDMVVSYAPERSIKCAKACVASVQSTRGDHGESIGGFDTILGQVFEIVPMNDPTRLETGDTLKFQVLFKGAPLADAEVSVIPRGKALPPMGEENEYDLMTDMDGMASFVFTEANYHLIVAHLETDESGSMDGKTYTKTKYTADLTVIVSPVR